MFGGEAQEQNVSNPFLGKPFYCWDQKKLVKDTCCFNHMVGLPMKNGKVCPIYNWQTEILDAIDNYQHLWIKKSRGIGATTLVGRKISHFCVTDDKLANQSIFIVAGTREDGANRIKEKYFKNLFSNEYKNIMVRDKYTEMILNKTLIKVFPTKQLKDMRGESDVAFVIVDEADFFDKKEQDELPFVIKAFEEKSNAKIIMVSTPNKPDGLFATIEKQTEEECSYHRLYMGYEKGLGTIYDPIWIAKEKVKDPTFFEREYNLKYMGGVGNVFSAQAVNIALELGDQFKDYPEYPDSIYHAGVDPGFGSSKTAIVVSQWIPEYRCIKVVYAEEFDRPNPNHIVDECFRLMQLYNSIYFWCDMSNAGFITEMKTQFDEDLSWRDEDRSYVNPDNMQVLPINFGTEHKALLSHLYQKFNKPMVAVPRKFDKLEIALRSAQATEYSLDKDETSYDDLLDALRLAIWGYRNI